MSEDGRDEIADGGGGARDGGEPGGGERGSGGGAGAHAVEGGRDGDDVAAPLARWFLWADSPSAVERLIRGLAILCALLFVFDIFWHRHAYVPGEGLWGYHAIAGFVSFTLIVLGAKKLRTFIRRGEDYYGAAAIDAERYPAAGIRPLTAIEEAEEEGADELLRVREGRVVGERGAGEAGEGGS